MIERNGERFYETSDINMGKVHAAMTEVGRRLTAAQFPDGDEDGVPKYLEQGSCMLCGTLIVYKDGDWLMMYPGAQTDRWWIEHCTGHDLRGLRGENPNLRHTPAPDLTSVEALEEWLHG